MSTTITFPIKKVQQLRQRAEQARQVSEGPQGWSKSKGDPMKLLDAFSSLSLKKGFALRSYQFQESGNGNGIVWAMLENLTFPEPEECTKLEDRFLAPPKPPGALDNIMEAIEGDESPWSYLSASLFAREIVEFGAMWHGCDWSTHAILGDEPLISPHRSDRLSSSEGPSGKPDDWRWLEPIPSEWRPEVSEDSKIVKVAFYTFSEFGRKAIHLHQDSYKPSRYCFESDERIIAEGPGGFVY